MNQPFEDHIKPRKQTIIITRTIFINYLDSFDSLNNWKISYVIIRLGKAYINLSEKSEKKILDLKIPRFLRAIGKKKY